MKVLIVATDIRSFLDLKNVVIELKKNNIEYFFLYSQERTRQFPTANLDKYSYDTNCQVTSKYFSPTLGITLPFIPDLLLITNENWEPEKIILTEFKQQGTIIACVENTSWIVGTIKSRLEMLSRLNFPTNCIDIFFESSKWSLETKKLCGWYDFKSVIVGNPKYDTLEEVPEKNEGVLVFGTMEKEACQKVYKILEELDNTNQPIYYRPHPGEDVTKLKYNNIKLVLDQAEVPYIAANTSTHLSNISISTYIFITIIFLYTLLFVLQLAYLQTHQIFYYLVFYILHYQYPFLSDIE